jgi:hypothetical protein
MRKLIALGAVTVFICTGIYLSKHAEPVDHNSPFQATNNTFRLGRPPFGEGVTEPEKAALDKILSEQKGQFGQFKVRPFGRGVNFTQ